VLDSEYIRFNQIKANGGRIMNTPTTLDMKTNLRSNAKTQEWVNALRNFPTLAERFRTIKSAQSNKVLAQKAHSYHLGEAVHHGSFGSGTVKALWPDGRVLVRFDRAAKNQLIFPSFLS